MAAAENYTFSKHLLGDGGLHDIIKAFCVHKQTLLELCKSTLGPDRKRPRPFRNE